jgi:XTP/dITP diphosphohydrolase
VAARDNPLDPRTVSRVVLASSNRGKLREYRRMAAGSAIAFDLIPGFRDLPAFHESAPTFAENSAGKALHYSQFTREIVLADDSGLVVPALGGAPGVESARYAGPDATDADRVQKLLREMASASGERRRARFVCIISLAQNGRALAILSDFVEGLIAAVPQGARGFGYDPVFFSPDLGRTFAQASEEEKDRLSHRGRAFRKILSFLEGSKIL